MTTVEISLRCGREPLAEALEEGSLRSVEEEDDL